MLAIPPAQLLRLPRPRVAVEHRCYNTAIAALVTRHDHPENPPAGLVDPAEEPYEQWVETIVLLPLGFLNRALDPRRLDTSLGDTGLGVSREGDLHRSGSA
jgi:hypothetical protein